MDMALSEQRPCMEKSPRFKAGQPKVLVLVSLLPRTNLHCDVNMVYKVSVYHPSVFLLHFILAVQTAYPFVLHMTL